MKKNWTSIIIILISCNISFAQKHDRLWLSGYQGGPPVTEKFGISFLDFANNQLQITSDIENVTLDFFGANVTFSDKDGNHLFSSNGVVLVDSTFEEMPGGHDFSDYSDDSHILPQGVLALPFPEQDQKSVFLFAEKGFIVDPPWSLEVIGLYNFTIDMTQNSGLGGVTLRRNPLIIDTLNYGKLTATRHANGRDWWVVVNKSHSNIFYKLLLSPEGINIYDQQAIGEAIEEGLGQAVFSPNGDFFVTFSAISAQEGQFIDIYDFDRCTGYLSNYRPIHYTIGEQGGVAISLDSRYLYVSADQYIFQYDLLADNIESTRQTVAIYDGYQSPFGSRFFLAQLAPDGKIYLNSPNGEDVLHVIHHPNQPGLACEVEQHGIQLPTYNGISLPNHPNYRLGPLDGSPCDTLGIDNIPIANFRVDQDTTDFLAIEFQDLSYYEPATWSWDFGDGYTSTDTCPAHTYIQNGIYEVCLTVSNSNGSHTDCRNLNLGITALEETTPEITVHLMPNPCTDFLNLSLGNYMPQNAQLHLFNNSGQLIKQQQIRPGVNRVDLVGQAAGLYHYTLLDDGRLLKTGKVVKM